MIDATTHVVRDGVRWEAGPEVIPRIAEIVESNGVTIKESGAKLVSRHTTAGGTCYIKHYRHSAFMLRPLKFFFKPSQARREWDLAVELENRGIPIVKHMALGERWKLRGLLDSFLITESFDGVPLSEVPQFDPEKVMQFVRRMAAAHVLHTDFHPANLLIEPRTQETRLVDLDGATLADDCPPDIIEKEMLAQLAMTCAIPAPPEVLALARQKRKQAFATRSKRCLKTNRDFAIRRAGRLAWHVRLDSLAPALQSALSDPDAFVAKGRILKNGRSSTVAAASGVVLKRFNFRRWLRPVKDIFRTCRALQAYRKAYHLELCGIPTARPLAAGEERCCGLVLRGFVLTQEIAGARELSAWAGDKRAASRALGRLIGRLHHEGFSHRDLKETNILFDAMGSPLLVDLEGVAFESDVSHDTAAGNLRRLARGAAECGKLDRGTAISFLLSYCRTRQIRPRDLFPR